MAKPIGSTTHPSLPSSGLLCVFYDLVFLSPRKVRDPLKRSKVSAEDGPQSIPIRSEDTT